MGRRALEPGEHGRITLRGMHPEVGRWRSEASLKADRVRPKRWRAEVRYHDPELHKVRVITAEGDGKGAATESLEAALRQVKEAEGLNRDLGSATMERLAKAHLRALEAGEVDLAPATVRVYASLIRAHMLGKKSTIGHVPLRRLTALQIEGEMARISALGAHSQLRNWKAIMNAILKRAVKAQAIPTNPMVHVSPLSAPRVIEKRTFSNGQGRRVNRALSAEEDAQLLAQLEEEKPHVADLVRVVRYMGLRIGEATSLRVIDLDDDTVTVAGKLVRVRGEGRIWDPVGKSDLSLRTLPIRSGAREALHSRLTHVQSRSGCEYLFAPPGSLWPDKDYYTRQLRGVFDRAGLPDVTSHTLRRTVERELELAGATVSERETFMGHTERVARRHYADHGAVRSSVIESMDQAGEKVE